LKPDFAEAWNSLGNSYVRIICYRSAIICYKKALQLKPDYAQAWWGLGGSSARSGNRNAAFESIRKLRKYDPQRADQLLNLINGWVFVGENELFSFYYISVRLSPSEA
jgi:protein O-GlcNAc transferase